MSNGDRVTMFGSSNSAYGSTDCNMILKTKGKIKIQWQNKFIDLLKDGKLNVDVDFIFSVNDKDDIGNKDGFYILENGDVWLKVGDLLIPIISSESTAYVSFMGTLITTSELKYTALHNIGFYYESISDVDSSVVLNGVIYIEDELKFYVIVNGVLSEMTIDLPNPITELVVIAKNDSDIGAIFIQGQGIENSIAFDGLYIYVDEDGSLIVSDENIYITVDDNLVVSISSNIFRVWLTLVTDYIQSNGATIDNGFRLYIDATGESWLEVDNILVRNAEDEENPNFIYPTYWIGDNNIVTDVDYEDSTSFVLTLQNLNTFLTGDTLVIFVDLELDDYTAYTEVRLTVTGVNEQEITVTADTLIEDSQLESVINGYIFKIRSSNDDFIPIRVQDSNIDIVLYRDNEYILLRVGNIEELGYTRNNNGATEAITGRGIYSEVGVFTEALYESNYVLDEDDNSSRFASTEWINTKLEDILTLIEELIELMELITLLIEDLEDYVNELIENITVQIGDLNDQLADLINLISDINNEISLINTHLDNVDNLIENLYELILNLGDDVDVSINNALPYGTIIMYYGTNIPDGWALCDGTNGTPNLIDRFILAGTSCSPSTDDNSMDYPVEINSSNVPVGSHTHSVSSGSQTGTGTVSFNIPNHTHNLRFVNTSTAKRVETGDGQGAQSYHFGGVGSIYKDDEQWDAATGSGGVVTSLQWDGSSLVQEAGAQSISTTVNVTMSGSSTGQTGDPSTGTDRTLTIRPPRYYVLVFIMKIT